MNEPPIEFPTHPDLDEATKTRVATLNDQISKLAAVRDGIENDLNAIAGQLTTDVTTKHELQSMLAKSLDAEIAFLDAVSDVPPALVSEAREIVKQRENDANTAHDRITAELENYGLPFANKNQFKFFIDRSQAYRQFRDAVDSARSFETEANQLRGKIQNRIKWLRQEIRRRTENLPGRMIA